MSQRICWSFLLVIPALSSLSCFGPPPPATGSLDWDLLILGVSIVDTEASKTSEPRDILIDGGMIVEVGDPGTISHENVSRILTAEGLYALPGLIDVHAHIGDGGIGAQVEEDRQGALSQFVRYGVTSIFAPGGGAGNDDHLAAWKQRCGAREFLCPGLFGSGSSNHRTGQPSDRHCLGYARRR